MARHEEAMPIPVQEARERGLKEETYSWRQMSGVIPINSHQHDGLNVS